MITEHFPAGLDGFEPVPDRSEVAIGPPGLDPGMWAGAPSAVLDGTDVVLAYRLRRPIEQGRGYAVVVARSADGVRFETIAVITREQMDAESLERPALVRTPWETWRLYLSCATWGTKHWRVEMLEAPAPDAFVPGKSAVVLPGDPLWAVKDPVIVIEPETWHLWASLHPLDDPDHTDRMTTGYFSSPDGVDWKLHGHALTTRPGEWDARGARVSAVRLRPGEIVAYYDGRASAGENYEERTGLAAGTSPAALAARTCVPIGSGPDGSGGLRYLDIVPLADGHERWYYELTRPDGLHELRTELR